MKKFKNKTFLVLGGAGFIGSHFCDLLHEKGANIICVDNLSLGSYENVEHLSKNKNFKFFKLDINKLEYDSPVFNNKISTVIHLAANSDIAKSHADPNIDIKNTLNSTLSILRLMRRKNISEIIFASSSAVYGLHESNIHENIGPLFPHSHYGAAKLASEAFISSYCENYSMKSWIIRFPNVIGNRCTHGVIYDFFNKIKSNSSILQVLGDGKQDKPYLYVNDLINGIIHFYLHTDEKINYVNLGTDTTTTVNKIIEIMKDVFEINPKIEYTGGSKGWVGDIPKFKYDLSKIYSLGWKSNLSSDAAVRETFKVLKDSWM